MTNNKVVKKKDGWYVQSQAGKNLGGPYDTEGAAEKRLTQVEAFKHNELQTITANIGPMLRHDRMEGREFIVAPMVMLTEGVHAGSNGPLYYPPEELSKTPAVWNHKPIVVYHPEMNGQAVSACDPDIITNRKVGVIMRAGFDAPKLHAEAWMEVDRLKEVDERVLDALEAGKMVEVSTGLFTDNEKEEGEWNGESYTAIARNFRPDHLAILPDRKGACSIADGAGLMRNAAERLGMDMDGFAKLSASERYNCIALVMLEARMSANDKSHQRIWNGLSDLVRKTHGKGIGAAVVGDVYVVDVFDAFCIFEKAGKLFKQAYSIDESEVEFEGVKLEGDPLQVKRVTEYRTLDGSFVGNNEENDMTKKELVDGLIQNETLKWNEEDQDFLMGLTKDQLEKFEPVKNETPADEDDSADKGAKPADGDVGKPPSDEKPVEKPAGNEDLTVEQYIAKAPVQMRDMLNAGLATHNAMKSRLIKAITSNDANDFTEADLQAKPLAELQAMVKLAGLVKKEDPTANNFIGLSDVEGAKGEEPLTAPVMNFDKE